MPIQMLRKLYCDNKVAIVIVQNPVQRNGTKHIEHDGHTPSRRRLELFGCHLLPLRNK